MPSGPELSNTRLTTLPSVRWPRDLLRERDLDDLISFFSVDFVRAGFKRASMGSSQGRSVPGWNGGSRAGVFVNGARSAPVKRMV